MGRRQPYLRQFTAANFPACLSLYTMLLSAFATTLCLLPFASAGVHKLKLNKLPQVLPGHALETAYLAEKYGAAPYQQLPLMGAGGAGRHIRPPTGEDDLFWTQEVINGGHDVPLTSV